MKNYEKWSLFEKVWLITFTIINIYLFFAWEDTVIGLITSLTGMLCVILVAKGRISNYIFGFINVVLYGYLALKWGLMGEVMLNWGYFLPMNFIGWYFWIKNKDNDKKDIVKTKLLYNNQRIKWIVISLLSVVLYGTLLKYLHTFTLLQNLNLEINPLPYIDATSTVLSIIAMILMVKRYAEQWVLWIVVNVVSIIMWFYTLLQGGNDISMLVMWSAYLVNSIYGLINWIKIYRHQN